MQNEYRKGIRLYHFSFIISLFAIAILFIISLFVGRFEISPDEIMDLLLNRRITGISGSVITRLRIPRTLMAMLTGASLSVSGAIYQGTFNNKMASPDLLGVSSGASVGACIGILMSLSFGQIVLMSFSFGIITVGMTLLIAQILGKHTDLGLILSGIAIGGLMSSFIGLTKYLADDERKLSEITYWLLGSFSTVTKKETVLISPVLLICFVISSLYVNRIDVISLGKKEAGILGVNYTKTICILVMCATLLTAACTSVSGIIGWVGLSVPNIIRLIYGNQHRKVVMLSMTGGAGFMMLVDILARSLSPNEIPLSIITGLMGTPLFLLAVIKGKPAVRSSI